MIERWKYANGRTGEQLQGICIRILEARENGHDVPSELLTNNVVIGLMWAARAFGGLIGRFGCGDQQRALSACRLLIGHLLRDGLPAIEPYGIFTMSDLNALFHAHCLIEGSDKHPEIPFQIVEIGERDESTS